MMFPFGRRQRGTERAQGAPRKALSRKRNRTMAVLEELEGRTLMTGTWTKLVNPVPGGQGVGVMELLTDGTVLVQGGSNNTSKNWYKLTPDNTGSYQNGTWTTLQDSNVGRLFFSSQVLPDGRFFWAGGEYSTTGPFANSGEIYDPVANTWTPIANFPESAMGDANSETLPDGRILCASVEGPEYIYL